jgi:hypothetical protein
MTETVSDYVIAAVDFLAEHAWKLLPLYRFDPVSGLWHHVNGPRRESPGLDELSFGRREPRTALPESVLTGYLDEARSLVAQLEADPPPGDPPPLRVSDEFERLRWFPLPAEALAALRA